MGYRHHNTTLGKRGEKLVARHFQRNGYKIVSRNRSHNGDLTVCHIETDVITRIEVKIAYAGKNNVAQFCAVRTGHTDIKHADLVVMIGLSDNGLAHWYFVPSDKITAKTVKINLSLDSKSKYNAYRSHCI